MPVAVSLADEGTVVSDAPHSARSFFCNLNGQIEDDL
jgi:hypothetical protein